MKRGAAKTLRLKTKHIHPRTLRRFSPLANTMVKASINPNPNTFNNNRTLAVWNCTKLKMYITNLNNEIKLKIIMMGSMTLTLNFVGA